MSLLTFRVWEIRLVYLRNIFTPLLVSRLQSYNQMSVSISKLLTKLREAIDILKNASGEDHVVSEHDLRNLLNTVEGKEKALFFRIFKLAQEQEASGGRVTHKDLDNLETMILEQIFPSFRLASGDLSTAAADELSKIKLENMLLAKAWKAYSEETVITTAAELANILQEKVKGLHFNHQYKLQANIKVKYELANLKELTVESFLQTLADTGKQEYEGKQFYSRYLRSASSPDQFFIDFVEVQNIENKARAKEVRELMQNNLRNMLLIQFDEVVQGQVSDYYLLGIAKDGNLVFWNQAYYEE